MVYLAQKLIDMLNIFKKTKPINYKRLNELREQRNELVTEKFEIEQQIKRKVRYKEGSIEQSRYLYALKQNKNKVRLLNNKIQKFNLLIEKEKVNQLQEYLFNNYKKEIKL